MRVAIVAECFLPEINGVTNSVLRVIEHLERRGCECLVIAPGLGPDRYRHARIERVPALELPFYRSLSVGLPTRQVRAILAAYRPDVVHLAAPVVLGAAGVRAAQSLGIPSLAVYQTDIAGFSLRYGIGLAGNAAWRWLRRVHNSADLTLAPSSSAAWQLEAHGIGPVSRWGRGVDLERFHPRHRSAALHRLLAPRDELIVGYVGRLAAETQVQLLAHAERVPGVRTVVVGDGPLASRLRADLPHTVFVGQKTGADLASHVATMDVFVHTGFNETFCQSIQEALASAVPVVAPAVGGPLDLVRHGENGFLYPAGESRFIRSAVKQLVDDPAARMAMGQRARASVQSRTWERLGDELLGHYRSLPGLAGHTVAAA